jgi:hypothetical protein
MSGPVTYLPKQPAEVIPISVSFVLRLPTGETLQSSSTVTAIAISDGSDASSLVSALDVTSPIITVTFSGGAHGEDYRISFTGVSQNYTFEYDVIIQCREL